MLLKIMMRKIKANIQTLILASEGTVTEKTCLFYSFNQTIISHSFVSLRLYTVCFGILISLNITFSVFHVYTEILKKWKFCFKSLKSIGHNVCGPWSNLASPANARGINVRYTASAEVLLLFLMSSSHVCRLK